MNELLQQVSLQFVYFHRNTMPTRSLASKSEREREMLLLGFSLCFFPDGRCMLSGERMADGKYSEMQNYLSESEKLIQTKCVHYACIEERNSSLAVLRVGCLCTQFSSTSTICATGDLVRSAKLILILWIYVTLTARSFSKIPLSHACDCLLCSALQNRNIIDDDDK
jgi:hypothetical protein